MRDSATRPPPRWSQLDDNLFLLELFHGPTLAFKDFAMQWLGRLMNRALAQRETRATILGATSGDTGAAAIEAFGGAIADRRLHPLSAWPRLRRAAPADDDGRPAERPRHRDRGHVRRLPGHRQGAVQRSRLPRRDEALGRQLDQLGAHPRADRLLLHQPPSRSARRIGASPSPCRPAISATSWPAITPSAWGCRSTAWSIATNENDILARALASGVYKPLGVKATQSPSMDIQVSSNFERLLFEAYDRDAGALRALMGALKQSGRIRDRAGALAAIRARFRRLSRRRRRPAPRRSARAYRESGVVDRSAYARSASTRRARALARDPATPVVALATAHPAKFPDAVERAIGQRPALAAASRATSMRAKSVSSVLPNDAAAVGAIRARTREGGGLSARLTTPALGPARRHRRDAASADGLARRLRRRRLAPRARRRTRPLASARTHGVQGHAPAQRARNRRGDRERRRRSQRRDRRRADRLFRPRAAARTSTWRSTSSPTS